MPIPTFTQMQCPQCGWQSSVYPRGDLVHAHDIERLSKMPKVCPKCGTTLDKEIMLNVPNLLKRSWWKFW